MLAAATQGFLAEDLIFRSMQQTDQEGTSAATYHVSMRATQLLGRALEDPKPRATGALEHRLKQEAQVIWLRCCRTCNGCRRPFGRNS